MEKREISAMQAQEELYRFERDMAVKMPCEQTIFSYVLNKYLSDINSVKPQYHYTDINGFMGIMESKELWATNTRFLNDENECMEGLLLIQKMINGMWENYQGEKRDYVEQLQKIVGERIDRRENENIYSISFCKDGDLLSQWRGYGKKGGISIGFDLTTYEINNGGNKAIGFYDFMDRYHYENVSEDKRKNDDFSVEDGEFLVKLYKVIYDESKQFDILSDLLEIGMQACDKQMPVEQLNKLARDIMASVERLLPIFKNKGFEEEKEVRYIWWDNGDRNIYFRERNGIIVPYIRCMIRDYNCKELEIFPIKDIIVGPQAKQKEVIDGIKYFLQCNGYEYLVDKVRASKIPYRE